MYRRYEMMELTFHGAEPAGSKIRIDLEAAFTAQVSGMTTRVHGFYAGSGTYKIRFLPQEEGIYTYQVRGIFRDTGWFEVGPAADGQHGPVHPDGSALRHADGTYFYSFGTTVYALAHQDEALTEQTFRTLEENAFNKIRLCVFPKHYVYNNNEPEHFPFGRREAAEDLHFIDNLNQPRTVKPLDPEMLCFPFWDSFEAKLKRLFAMGMQVDLILFHPYDRWGHSHMKQEENLTYLEYVIRRFAAYPQLWWSMANEYDLFFDWKKEQWYEIDEYIAAHDPYHHMLSNHNCFLPYDFERPAITHVSLQHRTMILTEELMAKYGKPVLYDECCYEGNLKETWGSISAREMVHRFWQVTTMGGYCTHGEVLLNPDDPDLDNAVLWWAKGGELHGESPRRIAFLKEVIDSLPAPLTPWHPGFGDLRKMTREESDAIIAGAPGNLGDFLRLMLAMSDREHTFQTISEYEFSGHAGEEAYLFYYGINCFCQTMPNLPAGHTYKLEVLDAWNMTRETIATGYTPGHLVRLPGREYIALLATTE